MSVAVMKTKAELALVEQFRAIEARLPGSVAVRSLRAAAMALVEAEGLPHRRIEAWKYTDLRAMLKDIPPPAGCAAEPSLGLAVTAASIDAALGDLAHLAADRIVYLDGVYAAGLSRVQPHAGLTVEQLASQLATASATRAADLLGSSDTAPLTAALNTAFVTDGAIVTIAAGAALSRPLLILDARTKSGSARVTTRHHLTFGADAVATAIEVFATLDGAAANGHVNAASTVMVADGAHVTHVKAVLGRGETHLSNWTVELGGDANYRGFQYTESPALARHDITVTYRGPGAKLDLSGVFLATEREHIDTTLIVDHAVPSCESRELFKGVLSGHGRGVFQGRIVVRQIAQKTDGKQMAQVLMLSPDAEFDSKPELEIYADDVVCGHGATVIDIDQDQVFYLRARGIPLVEARSMLVQAFIAEALDRIEHETIRDALLARTHAWLTALDPST